ncbi:hypothetical protein GQX73_g1588 [Xylaria multiplex]|uniref:Ribosome assembly protein 3 n=1 Tax=Xylaria multiplex TaxID=323545 RepID=A0A7C8J0B6_9PEZI|nr:hypothetical protein GQX73_g1588 [Xylaria multiplex]
MAGQDQKTTADFTSYYLQQSTKEFAEDLDKIRSADDFKGDALPMLIKSLQQGTSMFSAADQKRIVDAQQAGGKVDSAVEESTHDMSIVAAAAMEASAPYQVAHVMIVRLHTLVSLYSHAN